MKNLISPELVDLLFTASKVTVLTGSGISAESGVPTFRDAQTGLWARYQPEELATFEAFLRDPKLVWKWYTWRRNLVERALPNQAHYALVRMERQIPEFTLVTQNVDGLHQRAGNLNVIELHGNLTHAKCVLEGTIVAQWEQTEDVPPHCPQCGGLLRPDVVWFGETLPPQALETAWNAARTSNVFFSIGTSGIVQPAATLPYIAAQENIPVIEINPTDTPLTTHATWVLRGKAGEVLPALVREIWG